MCFLLCIRDNKSRLYCTCIRSAIIFLTCYCSGSFIFRFSVHIYVSVTSSVRYCVNIVSQTKPEVYLFPVMSLVFSPVKLPDFFRLTAHTTSEGRSEVEGHGETFSQAFPEKMYKKPPKTWLTKRRALRAPSPQVGSIFSGFLCCNTICHI